MAGPGSPNQTDKDLASIAEARACVAFHSGDAGYRRFVEAWGGSREFRSFDYDPFAICLSASPIADTLAALVCHGLFDRHPALRVATIECGSQWVEPLLSRLAKVRGQLPMRFRSDPVEQFKSRVWVSPYYEDDVERLRDLIGADHILFGSDYPHAEGLASPTDFLYDLKGFDEDEVRRVMRDNARKLLV